MQGDVLVGGITVITAVLGSTWYLGTKLGGLETSVNDIKNNHLHSLDERIGKIETVLMEGK